MAPKRVGRLDDIIRKVLVNGLATWFCVQSKVARKFLPEAVEQWGKLRRLEGGDIMHAHDIVAKRMDGRDASFVRVCELLYCQKNLKLIYLYLFPDSMSNSLIETSAIKTFLKSSSFKRSSGNFSSSSSSPFPKARNLKQRSLEMFVLRLFGKLMPSYPTPKGCRQFHSTHKVGPWTPLTSNPSNVLLVVLKTGGNGGWLTAVAHWLMRYLLRWISRQRHDRASEPCMNPFALRVAQCPAVVVHRALFGTTMRHRHTEHHRHAHRAPLSHTPSTIVTPTEHHRHTHRALAPLQLVQHRTPSSCRPPHLQPPFTAATSRLMSLQRPYAPGCGHSSPKWGVNCWSEPSWSWPTGPLGELPSHFWGASLILSSTYVKLGDLTIDFCVAAFHRDVPGLKHVAGQFVLLVGKVIALRLGASMLGRAVSPLFFLSWNISADCVPYSSLL